MTSNVKVKTAEKTMMLIEALGEFEGATLKEIMEVMEMPKSTAHGYLQTLCNLGYVIKKEENYYLSAKFLELGEKRRRRMGLYQAARPQIKKLAEKSGNHASLLIEENNTGVLLDYETGENALQLDLFVGQRYPLPVTAPGKAILAQLPDEQVASILDEEGIPTATQNTITDQDRLYQELEIIREQGYAIDNEEHVQGVRAVSTPVICNDTVLGSITIGGPVQRLTDERISNEFPSMLLEAANIIEVNYAHS